MPGDLEVYGDHVIRRASGGRGRELRLGREPTTRRTRVERDFDPAAVRALVGAADREVTPGGAELGAVAFRAGLVDECSCYLHPVSVGGGKPALPLGLRVDLELVEERRFAGGVVYARYRVRH